MSISYQPEAYKSINERAIEPMPFSLMNITNSEAHKKSLVELANDCLRNSIISQFSKVSFPIENTGTFKYENSQQLVPEENKQSFNNNEQIPYSNASVKFGSVDFENAKRMRGGNIVNNYPNAIRKTYDAQNIKSLEYQGQIMQNPYNYLRESSKNQISNQLNNSENFDENIINSKEKDYKYIYMKDEKDIHESEKDKNEEEEENLSSAEVTSEENFQGEYLNNDKESNNHKAFH